MACALDSYGELSLMSCAGAGHTSGKDLSSLGNELSEPYHILVIDITVFSAEYANLLSAADSTWSSGSV